MMSLIKKMLGIPAAKPMTEFSDFFMNASAREKKKVWAEVIRKANKDQRELIERYNKTHTKTA